MVRGDNLCLITQYQGGEIKWQGTQIDKVPNRTFLSVPAIFTVLHSGTRLDLLELIIGPITECGSPHEKLNLRKALELDRDFGADAIAHRAARECSKQAGNGTFVAEVLQTRVPMDVNRRRGEIMTPVNEPLDIQSRSMLETASGITKASIAEAVSFLRRGGACVVDVHTMWPRDYSEEHKYDSPDEVARRIEAITRTDGEKRITSIAAGQEGITTWTADPDLVQRLSTALSAEDIEHGVNTVFDPEFLKGSFAMRLCGFAPGVAIDIDKELLLPNGVEDYFKNLFKTQPNPAGVERVAKALTNTVLRRWGDLYS
ncbi:hypothetical protein HOG48_01135 [Candidatus Peregrinibacteria bacterium]|jgi:hypothetical protein|nr:hypothetical protein [Candidatus Peregrinibacteria bacterium]